MALFRRRHSADHGLPLPPDDLGADLAMPLFGAFLGAGAGALRLTAAGLVLRQPGAPDGFVPRADVVDAEVEDTVLAVRFTHDGEDREVVIAGEDPAAYASWLTAIPSSPTKFEVSPPKTSYSIGEAEQPMPLQHRREPTASTATSAGLVGGARPPALLVLEDGRWWRGEAFGAVGENLGEAVFNTGMTGYQETLTDPSYHRQVVVMTAPHIGNTGMNDLDCESDRIWVAGYVVREPSRVSSSWRAEAGLNAALVASGVVGVAGIDTRAVTRHLRDRGAMRCAVSSTEDDPQALLERVLASPGMAGADLAREVSTSEPYVVSAAGERRFRVAALDLGMKRSIPAYLAQHGCEVHVLPATSTADDLLAIDPDGIFLSNGPGDPAVTSYAVDALRGVLGRRPVFGICLGHQILGRALGLPTYKLRFGHRGVNQPVQDLATGRVAITSHNHGFAVEAPDDPAARLSTDFGAVQVSHVDLNDRVVEGLRCLDVPAFSVQYHPEAAAGPHDSVGLFADFAALMTGAGARA